jgi:hypothetical protein
MITVLRAYGLKVFIFSDDHEPAHVHVRGDGQAKIKLVGADGQPEVMWSAGMTQAERGRALRAVREAQTELLEKWRRIHGAGH